MENNLLYLTICHVPLQVEFPEMEECCKDVSVTHVRIVARVFKFYAKRTTQLKHIIDVLNLTEIY